MVAAGSFPKADSKAVLDELKVTIPYGVVMLNLKLCKDMTGF